MCHRRPGGDHVVDHDDPPASNIRTGPEHRARQDAHGGFGPSACPPWIAIEQPTCGNAELYGDVASEQFALIEPSLPTPRGARRRPCDHVDPAVVTVFDDLIHHESGEMPPDLATIAVLQPEHHVAGATGEWHGGVHPV